jgi:hypothetical protein
MARPLAMLFLSRFKAVSLGMNGIFPSEIDNWLITAGSGQLRAGYGQLPNY